MLLHLALLRTDQQEVKDHHDHGDRHDHGDQFTAARALRLPLVQKLVLRTCNASEVARAAVVVLRGI